MLDEVLEFKEYTDTDKKRISKADAKDGTYRRPLVIVTRGYLFDDLKHDIKAELTKSEIEKTKEVIKNWCEEFLPDYLVRLYESKEKAEIHLKKIPDLSGRKKAENRNDENDLTYNNIIADALEQGPLVRYYLAAKKIDTEEKYEEILSRFIMIPPDKQKVENNKKKLLDSILKIMVAYLINVSEGNEWCLLSQCDFARWGLISRFWKWNVTFDGEKIIEKEVLVNNTKIHVSRKFIEQCGWCVMNQNELDEAVKQNEKLLYYKDAGAKKPLIGSWD